ncbi:putative PLP-dependent enzyme possibly involved in cell wall biogenesis [SAR116 cluster alpha proteobacterium HIMB100]|nr:putative PLP-dependent enzyme possibly involved in cell wall biogenesis [SAR116 cluster alpha proteobacterium HIMB100]
MTMSFIDLAAQQKRLRGEIEARLNAVLDHGGYIMGAEVAELERSFCDRLGVKHTISCSSGTDALILGLLGLGVNPGDGVIVPSFTFAASAEAIAVLGACPVFAEVGAGSFNLDTERLGDALTAGQEAGLNMVGIIPVGLFGQPAALDQICAFAAEKGLWVMDDAAQSFGAMCGGQAVGRFGAATATSFFPAKPLGCYGDGGALFTDDDNLAEIARSARVHGQGADKYENERIGMTARLDTMQAAVLLAKLGIFDDELTLRQQAADRYAECLAGSDVTIPVLDEGATSSWAQYVIRLPHGTDRQAVQDRMKADGVPTAVYYPRPMHTQKPYARYPVAKGGLAVTEALAADVLALPMHPYLSQADQDKVADALTAAL